MEDTIWILIPLAALLIPIVAILVRHQQKMAELIHGAQPGRSLPSVESQQMRQEIQELKQLVHEQAITIDSLSSRLGAGQPASIEDRVRD